MSLLGFPIFRYIDIDETVGKWTRDYPITYEVATALGLHVVKGILPELYQLMSLYPQPVRHQPSVEYIPLPRFKGPAHK
jgi:hypothetical protein